MKKLVSLLAALALVLTLLPATALANEGDFPVENDELTDSTADPGGTTPSVQSGTLTLRREPDSDSVDLGAMSYPALIYVHPTLTVNGEIIPEGQYTIRYTWTNREGLIVRNVNTEYNVMAVYKELPGSNVYLDCTATATYNGQTYTAFTKWTNLYRDSDYGGSASTQPKTCKVSFKPNPGSVNGSTEIISREYTAGDTLGALPEPIRENYIFEGWKDSSGNIVTPGTVVPNSSTMWLQAVWKPVWETAASAQDFEVKDTILKEYTGTDTRVVIPDGITSIRGFISNTNLTSVVIPGSVKSVGFQAFAFCKNLSEVTLTEGLETIDAYAFQGCKSLTSIVIPNGVTTITFLAFDDCTALTSVTIPASVTDISSSAFSGCKNLTIYGQAGSYAETFAREQGIPFVAGSAPDPSAAPAQPAPTAQPNTTERPSSWAEAQVNAAISAGIVPAALQSAYTRNATRAEFCALATALYESSVGMPVAGRTTFTDTADENVEKMAFLGVVNGVGNGKFDPDAPLTREQAATMLSRLASAAGKPMEGLFPSFADENSISSWARSAVAQMQRSGVMNGVGDNRFDPAGPYTREQSILTMFRLQALLIK